METYEINAEYTDATSLLNIPPEVAGLVISGGYCGGEHRGEAHVTFRVYAEDEEIARAEGERLARECGRGLGADPCSIAVHRVGDPRVAYVGAEATDEEIDAMLAGLSVKEPHTEVEIRRENPPARMREWAAVAAVPD